MGEIIYDTTISAHAISKKNKMRYWKGMVLKDPSIGSYERALISHFKQTYTKSPYIQNIKVEITITWKDNRRRDIQNALDIILDVGQGIIYNDDSQIQEIVARKIIEKGKSEIHLIISKGDMP